MLVVLFFMHVKYSTKLTKLTIFAGIFMFLTLISMTLADYISRPGDSGRTEISCLARAAEQRSFA